MLRIYDTTRVETCEGVSRRELLRIGALGLGGVTLPGVLSAKAGGGDFVRDKSVVVLFLGARVPFNAGERRGNKGRLIVHLHLVVLVALIVVGVGSV